MNSPESFYSDLCKQIASNRALVIVGAGVSIGATEEPCASWAGLLKHGITRCCEVGYPKPRKGWADLQLQTLESGDLDELLTVAESIERRLRGPEDNSPEYGRWLRETIAPLSLSIKYRGVLDALRDLKISMATTNYDSLLEVVTNLSPITYREGPRIVRLQRKEEKGILHLHGHWQDPESIVLGIRSYQKLLGDDLARVVQQSISLHNTIVFVGFGRGFDDPNFSALRRWMRRVLSLAEHRHYFLHREGDDVDFGENERLFSIVYGPKYTDLEPFLRSLVSHDQKQAASRNQEQAVLIRAADVNNAIARFSIVTRTGMTFQQFLDEAYWLLNARQVPVYEYTYGHAWMVADENTGIAYRKLGGPGHDDVRTLEEVGIRPGQTLMFIRLEDTK
jgi:hypothetical protein